MNEVNIGEYGGKGRALLQLQRAGFNVPHFVVLPVPFFEKLDQDISGLPGRIVAACSCKLLEWQTMFDGKPVAVRSSAVAEDSSAHSFAGQFKTLLNVPIDRVPEAVAEVWLSVRDTESYTTVHSLAMNTHMAVVLQQMVDATCAGVAFSAHPVNGTMEVIINAISGLGDKLVDGSVTADQYTVLDGEIVARQPFSVSAVLSDEQILKVAATVRECHRFFNGPQDMEFAFQGDELYVLQSRPITTIPKTSTVWDNSNIVESYPGLTQPLTFSFIQKMYDAVYRQFSQLLGVTKQKVANNGDIFSGMLGLLNGRVYYNLNSWYQALALLPGYNINASFMEKMMGVKDKPDVTIVQHKSTRLKGWWEVGRAIASILKNLTLARRQAADFKIAFNSVYSSFGSKGFSNRSLDELWQDYQTFETLMVREWKAPLVNDFFAMIYFGLLQTLCVRLAPNDGNLHNRLLAGSNDVMTTQPMKELPKIAEAIALQPSLLKLAKDGDAGGLYEAMQQPEYCAVWQLFTNYIATWGERSVAELKLETITYHQEPLMLVLLLQSYLQQNWKQESNRGQSCQSRNDGETMVGNMLRGKPGKRMLFNHVLRNARYFVTQRENLRYYRTRGFGMVRRMMLAIGEQLGNLGLIDCTRDIFWLTLDEVKQAVESPKDLHSLVSQRKALYKTYGENDLPQRVTSFGLPKGVINIKPVDTSHSGTSKTLNGIACSAGIVRAPVRLVAYSDEMKSLDGAILATYATDPGFVVLFASASGILTERGSLLSHAAIVGREMGIPCIVGIEGLMGRLKDGDIVEMDGNTGTVTIINA